MLRLVLLLALAAFSTAAQDIVLVKGTDSWRYRGVTNTTPTTEPWTALDYDDSNWAVGLASFATPGGFFSWPETTILTNGPISYTFRKKFEIANPESIRTLILRIDYEHGFVAHLNGAEIARRGFPITNTPVPLNAVATFHQRGATEFIDASAGLQYLQPGTNILAFQIHNTGEDLDFVFAPELLANFARGPFVQNASRTSIQIIWKTLENTTGFVLYGKDQTQPATAFSPDSNTTHAITLTNLDPGQKYFYRVFTEKDGDVAASDWANFQTLKPAGSPIRFQVFGDTGQLTTGQYNIANRLRNSPADLVLHTGDVLYPYYIASQADLRCFSIYRDHMRTTPYYFAMGNHDGYWNLTDYQNDFYLPTNSATGSEMFYSFDHGDAHFVTLTTDTQSGQRYNPGSIQYNWLENDLATSTQRWKFIYFHHIIRSSSLHSDDDYLFDGIADKFAIQSYIGGLAERHNAHIIFNGHDHNYERFASFNGVNSFVTGGGGASTYPQNRLEPGSVQYRQAHHFLDVTVNGPDLTIEAVDDKGIVIDRFHRSQASVTNFNSQWGSPIIESITGVDPSGNIPGQRFDFSGRSIPTRAGRWGNMGRIHVRNDNANVYVGFEQAVLHKNQIIALFLENPVAPGVSDIRPLGNDQLDGDVDGLDLVFKLGFKNFKPSIACLLGDELADANSRGFHRPQMRFGTGQGVFRLDQTFSTVEGARLQQFNRDPQVAASFAESNADFIEVAIPREALSNPTATIRLGAVILSDTNSDTMELELDTAYAGTALEPGDLTTFLEPLSIQLAPDPNFSVFSSEQHQLRFSWNSVPGTKYWIQQTTDLSQPFLDITNGHFPITALFGEAQYDMEILSLQAPQFFRLRWE